MNYRLVIFLAVLPGMAPFASAQTPIEVPDQPCSTPPRVWASAEYLLWWTKDSPLPVPLATYSSPADLGVLGAPSTVVALGNENLDLGRRQGGRFTLGSWLDDELMFGIEGNYFFLATESVSGSAHVNGQEPRVLALPFVDVTPGGAFRNPATVNREVATLIGASIVANPGGAFSGTTTLSLRSQLWGAEVSGLVNATRSDNLRLDLLGGFRYIRLRETLDFSTSSPNFPVIPGEFFLTHDSFDATNNFYGGQIRARASWSTGPLSIAATGKVALGSMQQSVAVSGLTATNDFTGRTGPGLTLPGGYLALPTNIGTHRKDRFAVVPEGNVNLAYQPADWVRLNVGYTFLYLSSVVRPGEQIDRTLNTGQSPSIAFSATPPGLQGGPARPAPLVQATDFWAQGITFGVEFRY